MSQWFRRSRDSTSSSHSPPSSFCDDVGSFFKPSDPPTLSRLFSTATEFHKVLAGSHCIESRSSDCEDSHGFDDLVGRDLDSSEQAAAGHVARLRATRYSWGSYELTAEPESFDQSKVPDDEFEEAERFSVTPADAQESDSDRLGPSQIIDILIEEFGPLASDDSDERESLVLETDGCMICQDVFIVV
jgi:sterol 3beta-glucosyltransferase